MEGPGEMGVVCGGDRLCDLSLQEPEEEAAAVEVAATEIPVEAAGIRRSQ